jgi:cation diffusion facilitator CzcD-associated flavoprotein CzcO
MPAKNTIIIGAGVSGIAMAHTLRCRLGYTDFEVYSGSTIMTVVADSLSRSLRSAIPLEARGKSIHILDGKSQTNVITRGAY